MLVHSNLLNIVSVVVFAANAVAASSYYGLPDLINQSDTRQEDIFQLRRLQECRSECMIGTQKIEKEWHSGSCCGELRECCEAGPTLPLLVQSALFFFFVIVIACIACCCSCSPDGLYQEHPGVNIFQIIITVPTQSMFARLPQLPQVPW